MSATTTPEPAPSSVLASTARGAGWMVAFRLLNRLLGLMSILVLVRLLAPEDFGLVALAFAFTAALDAFTTIGLEVQLVRSREVDRDLYDTAFTLNLVRSLALALLLVGLSGWASEWLREPQIEAIMLALAGMTVLGGFGNVAVVDFMRQLDFAREFILRAVPRLVQAVSGIVLAFLLANHWALLGALLASTFCGVVLGYAMRPYRPRLTLVAWRVLFSVSLWTWLLAITHMLRDRLDNLLVGRLLGPRQVGIYTVSVEISYLPMSELVGPVCRACGAGFAASLRADAQGEAASAFRRILALTALVALPTGFGISLVAGPVVLLALGPAWGEAAELVAVLSIAYMPVAFGMVAAALLTAKLQVKWLCLVTGCAAVVRLSLLAVTIPWLGLTGVGYGAGLAMLAENAVLVALALRATGLEFRSLLPHVWRPAAASAVMVLALWWSGLGWGGVPAGTVAALQALAVASAAGVVAYAASVTVLWMAAGRPKGAEQDMLVLLSRSATAASGRLQRSWAAIRRRVGRRLASGGGAR